MNVRYLALCVVVSTAPALNACTSGSTTASPDGGLGAPVDGGVADGRFVSTDARRPTQPGEDASAEPRPSAADAADEQAPTLEAGAEAAGDEAAAPDDGGVDALPVDAATPAACNAGDGGLMLNCASQPSACCFPDDTNTGVPPGVTLTPSGSLDIQDDGTVIDGLDISGTVDVYANNVTIKNSRLTVSSSGSYGLAIRPGVTGTVIQDSTLRGQDNTTHSVEYAIFNISGAPVIVTRANLYNCSECVSGAAIQLSDSYLHDMADPPGAHIEGTYTLAGSLYTHNTILNSYSQTAAVYMDPNLGGTLDCQCSLIRNLLAGGGYTLYGGSSTSAVATDVTVKDNRFSRLYYPNGGYWGAVAYFDDTGTGNVWSGNIWDDTGMPLTP